MARTDVNIFGDTNTGLMSVEAKEFYEKNFMVELRNNLVLYNLCDKHTLPKNVGETDTWRLFKDLAPVTKPLDELPDFKGQKLKVIDFSVKIAQYGDYLEISRKVDLLSIDPILSKSSELLGRQAGETFENKVMDGMLSGTNVWYGGTGTSRSTAGALTIANLNRIKAYFKKANVKPAKGGMYIAIISPEVEMDLKNLTAENASWIDITKYAHPEDVYEGEIGTFMGFRWIVSNSVREEEGVHKCIFMGNEAIGVVNLEGESNKPKIIHHGYGDAGEGASKALNRVCTLGWVNEGFNTRIQREEALIRVEVKVSETIDTEIDDATRFGYKGSATGNTFDDSTDSTDDD